MATPTFRYNAFISYSHAADGALAPSLRDGLQRFATPWRLFRLINPIRSLRVFQDQASLSANPALWPTIEKALAAADWFILLASPEAARSPWVEKEIDFWRLNKPVEHLLIVQTDGEIAWDHDKNDFDWAKTTALPERLSAVFANEPRWIDARWARTGAQTTLRDPRFRNLVAELAAPIRGIAKDELIGEDIRQHRRLNSWRNAALGVVTMLLIGTIAAAAIALLQRDEALRNQSKALITLAMAEVDDNSPSNAVRIALAATPRDLTDRLLRPYLPEVQTPLLVALENLGESQRFIGHDEALEDVDFSPDGRTIVTASQDHTARLWDASSGQEVAIFRGHSAAVNSAAFSPDGRVVVTASRDNTARLWDAATGKEIAVLRGHENFVNSAAFSPDGRTLVTTSLDNTIRLWDAATAKQIGMLQGQKKSFSDRGMFFASFSPDGHAVAAIDFYNNAIHLWEASSGKEISLLQWKEPMYSFAFSPDGRTIVTTSFKNLQLWDVVAAKEITELHGREGPIISAAFSPDGLRVISGSKDRTVSVWDVTKRTEIARVRAHEDDITAVAVRPDGRAFVSASFDKTARLWMQLETIPALNGHEGPVVSVDFSPDRRTVVTASLDNTARLWDVVNHTELAVLRGHDKEVNSAAFSSDGRSVVTASGDGTVRLWEVASGREIAIFRGHEDGVRSAAFSPDGTTIVSTSFDGTLLVWDVASVQVRMTFRRRTGPGSSAVFSPDGRTFVAGSAETSAAQLWDAASGKEIAVLRHPSHEGVYGAAFSPDGTTIATTSTTGVIRLWDAASRNEIAVLSGHKESVYSAAFSADARFLVTSGQKTVRLWDLASAKEIAVLHRREVAGSYTNATFSPDGRTVVTLSGRQVLLIPTGQNLIDLACAWVPWPLSKEQRQRFGISEEWCTPEVAAELRAKLRLDEPETSSLVERESGTKRLEDAIEAYRAALQEYTHERVPLQWAMTQIKLGTVLATLGEQESGTKRLEDAIEAYRAALQEYTRERVPLQWAMTQIKLGTVLATLGEQESGTKRLQEAVAIFSDVLQVDPNDERAYKGLNYLYHDKLFAFTEAFDLNQAWLERHPDDLDGQANFAEAAFTVGRFAEAEQRLAVLVDHPKLEPRDVVPLRALEICSLVALNTPDTLKAKLDALRDLLKGDRDELAADWTWTFAGSQHFIEGHPELSRHSWLIRLLAAIEERNAADARAAVEIGQTASAAGAVQ